MLIEVRPGVRSAVTCLPPQSHPGYVRRPAQGAPGSRPCFPAASSRSREPRADRTRQMIEEANFEEDAHPAYTRILADLAPRRGADPEIPRRAGTAPLCGRAFRPPAAQ